jgi:phage tail sheath gpL-like
LIPGIEKVIADVKAGNESQALADLLALEPDAAKAYTDCTASNKVAMVLTSENKNMFGKVGDLATCISDIEAMIPGVEKVIADVKAGNESQALVDLLAMEP